jgi:hypothetical protein
MFGALTRCTVLGGVDVLCAVLGVDVLEVDLVV